jgi:hypothetical protein
MMDDDTLPDPMANIVMDNLRESSNAGSPTTRKHVEAKDQWQISKVNSDQYPKELHTSNQAMTKLSMTVEPSPEQQEAINRNWSIATEQRNARLHHGAARNIISEEAVMGTSKETEDRNLIKQQNTTLHSLNRGTQEVTHRFLKKESSKTSQKK